ncbi:MAG: hypothetical protein NC133_04540 [Prevotella sp.]|nr:hypothetical protein [Prevotella sp.]
MVQSKQQGVMMIQPDFNYNQQQRQKVEAILAETKREDNIRAMSNQKPTAEYAAFATKGRIGSAVDFTKETKLANREHPNAYVDNAMVDFVAQDAMLGRIYMEGTMKAEMPVAETTIAVVSPRWEDGVGVMTELATADKKTKPLQVYHARYETADGVINHLFDALTLSKAQPNIRIVEEKLREMNFPAAVREEVVKDYTQNLVHQNNDRTL